MYIYVYVLSTLFVCRDVDVNGVGGLGGGYRWVGGFNLGGVILIILVRWRVSRSVYITDIDNPDVHDQHSDYI